LLDSMVNVPGYNTQQPYITKDGKYLLFASDRPGGLGGYDLWYAVLDEKGKPVRIQNLGELNTPLNEQAPYFHEPSSTLVFASDGRTGMGGYDLFFVKGNIGAWSQPENFGHPVNSAKDDMYFTSFSKGRRVLENALFSSDRADVCCLELFHLARKAPPKHIIGQIVACDSKTPLVGVAVDVVDTTTGVKMFSGTTDSEGRYSFTVSQTTPLNSVAALKGYYTTARPLQWSADADADSLVSAPVCMEKELLVVDEVQILNNVYYEFAKADIRPESYPSLDDVVKLLNKRADIKVEIGGHTDGKGSDELNLNLSQARADNVVAYLISKGIARERLIAKGYGASMPIAPNKNADGSDNPEGREKNRRTEMKVLQ
jgi:OmpA-OmpF porin, OOP family